MNREKSIDCMKGIAILGIFFCHSTQVIKDLNSNIYWIFQLGQLGCQVFFFFTGYLMSGSVEKRQLGYVSYVKNKISGVIFPWYCAIIVYLILTGLLSGIEEFPYITNTNPFAIVVNLLFLNGVFPFGNNNVVFGGWYLGTMVLVWLIFPVLDYHVKKRGWKFACIMIMFCILSMVVIGTVKGYTYVRRNTFMYFGLVNQLPCILIGMLARNAANLNKRLLKNELNKVFALIIIESVILFLFYLDIPFGACFTPTLMGVVSWIMLDIFKVYVPRIPQKRIVLLIAWLRENSLYIYLFHIIGAWHLQWLLWKIAIRYLNLDTTVLFVAIMIICLPFSFGVSMCAKRLCSICKKQ